MLKRYFLLLIGVLACTTWVRPASDAATEVLALEHKIEDAVVRGDVAFVDSVLAADFSFVHGDGWTMGGKPLAADDKAGFLKRITDKEYLVHDLDGVNAEVHGDVVITSGRYVSLYMPKPQNAIPNATPGKLNLDSTSSRVYVRRNGQWQFLSHRTVHDRPYPAGVDPTQVLPSRDASYVTVCWVSPSQGWRLSRPIQGRGGNSRTGKGNRRSDCSRRCYNL